MKSHSTFIGVDYGSKLAGTTAVCFRKENQFHFYQSEKKKDADAFLEKMVIELQPNYIFLDAPLSLPGAFFNQSDDFFYRKGDREVRAMSPMFLGGLTARAMRMKSIFTKKEIEVIEVYPSQLLKVLFPEKVFKKKDYKIDEIYENMKQLIPNLPKVTPPNSHQLDALLCWYSGFRFFEKVAIFYGEKAEGGIWV